MGTTAGDRQGQSHSLLRLLSTDARVSVNDLADRLNTSKANALASLSNTTKERSLRFVPEISIDKVWKWEFIKRARVRTKRGILAEAVDELPATGFEEYVMLARFKGGKPGDAEIQKAIGGHYAAQFAARLKGDDDLLVYAVDRSYDDMMRFVEGVSKKLGHYRMLASITRVWNTFGFFPLSDALVEQFDIFDTYKKLLVGLNGNGRGTFTEIGNRFRQGAAQMLYAYDRLVRTEILKRVTYFEPLRGRQAIVAMARTADASGFADAKSAWFASLVKEYEKRENECVYMCDTPSPLGMLVIASFESSKALSRFVATMRGKLVNSEISYMPISRVLHGSLGIRDFDMSKTQQYRHLERNRLLPEEPKAAEPVENPDAI
jgi:DNA-binding Lrp family transcriptional regulator